MLKNRHTFVSRASRIFLALLACSAAFASAQRTVVEKNGVGGRIETDYNTAGKATEMRTIGTDGKLQQKANYEYLPGYYTAQQTDTTYWPNGQILKLVRHTYDESANFTGEFIQLFDESGKQTGGHKLTHDPWTGVYRCYEWTDAARDYRAVECPAGEEESGAPEELKRFTYDEVMKNLDAARENARRQQTMRPAQSATPGSPVTNTGQQEVGLVFPAHVRAGERISGTVVLNPSRYNETPEVTVTRVVVPFEPRGEASRLSGWLFETAGEEPRPADGPITLVVPSRESKLKITIREAADPSQAVSQTLNFDSRSESKPLAPNSFQSPALCMKGELCVVSGPFNGDSGKTLAAFEDQPAKIVAETSDAAYIDVPEVTEPGSRPLFIAEGMKAVVIPVAVGKFVVKNNGRELQAGETLITFPTLDGPGDIPEPRWQMDVPARSLQRAQQLIPGFQVAKGEREESEGPEDRANGGSKERREIEEKKQHGEILLVVQNRAPDQISLRRSKNEMLVFHLSDEAFRRGEFKYDLVVDAKKACKVDVRGYVIPFLAPVVGQEFSMKAAR